MKTWVSSVGANAKVLSAAVAPEDGIQPKLFAELNDSTVPLSPTAKAENWPVLSAETART